MLKEWKKGIDLKAKLNEIESKPNKLSQELVLWGANEIQ